MQKKNGISLIVLVITIIVMIILAGAIIISLNNAGIIGKANEAVDKSNLANIKQIAQLAWADAYASGVRDDVELGKAVVNGLNKVDGLNANDYIITTTSSGVTIEKANYIYYSTLIDAVNDVNNKTIGANADVDKQNAVAGVYTKGNNVYVTLLKGNTETKRIEPNADMVINLGGNVLSVNDGVGIDVISGNVTIDGMLDGSGIEIATENERFAKAIQQRSGNLIINGGTYISNTINGDNATIHALANLTINGANIISRDIDGSARGVSIGTTSVATISNCNIQVYSNYSLANESRGVDCWGNLNINNCNITSPVVAVANFGGVLHINKGIYEGYALGGLFLRGESNIVNATIRECNMPEGYTSSVAAYGSSVSINGKENETADVNVYMDNCNIYNSKNPIHIKSAEPSSTYTLYISNSKINLDGQIYIDSDRDKLYIGQGCNFTAENTNRTSSVIITNNVYTN